MSFKEGDRLSGGITPLIYKLGCRPMWVIRVSALAALLPVKKLWVSLNWRLGMCCSWSGCSGEEIVLLLLPRFEPQIFQHISWTFYWLCCLLLYWR